jgi:hypothetical protein
MLSSHPDFLPKNLWPCLGGGGGGPGGGVGGTRGYGQGWLKNAFLLAVQLDCSSILRALGPGWIGAELDVGQQLGRLIYASWIDGARYRSGTVGHRH